jgi:predicted DCC family thiol-disulfide oxidoreductase YuxK
VRRSDSTGSVLLYDGTCGFCAESVRVILRSDRRKTLRFAALDSAFGLAVRGQHPELGTADSVVWVDPESSERPERVLLRSAAAIQVARYLGGPWRVMTVAALLPLRLRDAVYDLVARHRHQLTRGGPLCLVPTAEERARFLG